ncbi:MAG: peptidoglycan -binding protein [Rhodospirillaceae bacterium]
MYGSGRRSARNEVNIWPGWVDALSSLIMVIIFVLMIFVVAQFYLAHTLTGRDQALVRLNQRIAELTDLLAVEKRTGADQRLNLGQLSDQLRDSLATREKLAADLAALKDERDQLATRATALAQRADASGAEAGRVSKELEDAFKTIDADREKITVQLREIAGLQADIKALTETRSRLEAEVAALTALTRELKDKTGALSDELKAAAADQSKAGEALKLSEEQRKLLMAELGSLRDRGKELEARIASEAERTALAQKEIDSRETRIRELQAGLESARNDLTGVRQQGSDSARRIETLSAEVTALRAELARLNAALDSAEAISGEKSLKITDLTGRLNAALANKVQELARYRSEFFGRMRETIGARPDIRIVGDRFVFQSEVLFPTGSANLQEAGKGQLAQLARTLIDIAGTIPPDVNWILRVDGHTDPRRIATSQFPSNWELSTARAISVVKFLIEQGIPSERLAATGFGEFQPLDPGTGEDALARNRRIELKLDQR